METEDRENPKSIWENLQALGKLLVWVVRGDVEEAVVAENPERGVWMEAGETIESRGNQMHVIIYPNKQNDSILCEIVIIGEEKKLTDRAFVILLHRGRAIVFPDSKEISNSPLLLVEFIVVMHHELRIDLAN
ncbi:MAG: hypothetical protein WC304_00950 [Candidatus Gracilibacteria bacterium]